MDFSRFKYIFAGYKPGYLFKNSNKSAYVINIHRCGSPLFELKDHMKCELEVRVLSEEMLIHE